MSPVAAKAKPGTPVRTPPEIGLAFESTESTGPEHTALHGLDDGDDLERESCSSGRRSSELPVLPAAGGRGNGAGPAVASPPLPPRAYAAHVPMILVDNVELDAATQAAETEALERDARDHFDHLMDSVAGCGRRRQSVYRIAELWGFSENDAAELIVNFESRQSTPAAPEPSQLSRRNARRLRAPPSPRASLI